GTDVLPSPKTGSGEALDLAGVMRRTHFGYRADGGGFSGGHATYAVKASAEAVSLWPGDGDQTRALDDGATTPFVASIESVARGEVPIADGVGIAAIQPDGSLGIERDALVEHLENREEGVEQSFDFAARPAGAGDLVIKFAVTGEAYRGK